MCQAPMTALFVYRLDAQPVLVIRSATHAKFQHKRVLVHFAHVLTDSSMMGSMHSAKVV
jgi:hypothetical protein